MKDMERVYTPGRYRFIGRLRRGVWEVIDTAPSPGAKQTYWSWRGHRFHDCIVRKVKSKAAAIQVLKSLNAAVGRAA